MLNPDFPSRYLRGSSFYCLNKSYEQEIYMSNAVVYNVPNSMHRFTPIYTYVIENTLSFLDIDIRHWEDKKILDLCCGNGFLSYHLFKLNNKLNITLLDINEIELKNAKNNLSQLNILNEPSFYNGNFSDSMLVNEYDIVVGSSFLHHFPDVSSTLSSIKNLLKPNGVFVSFYEPTLTALGWEKLDSLLAFEIAAGGNNYVENLRTSSNSPLQTTDVWVFEINELKQLFKMAGFEKVKAYPKSIAYTLMQGSKEYQNGDDDTRLALTKKAINLDESLINQVPDSMFGACAMSGIKFLS